MKLNIQLKYLLGVIAILFTTSVICGFILYHLSAIPFGILFSTVLYLFSSSLILLSGLISILCFRANRRWLRWTGMIPSLLALALILLTLIIAMDFRILHFKSLPPHPDKSEWIEDLHVLADQMEAKHRDLHALVSREEWEQTVGDMEARIPGLSEYEIVMELFRLSALPNDNHTFPFVMMPCFDLHSFPFQLYHFPDGWYIVDAGREYKKYIGTRLVKIGDENIEHIYENYPLLLASENEFSRQERFTFMVLMPEWLAFHGIIDNLRQAEFTLEEENGERFVLNIEPVPFFQHFLWSGIFTIENNAPAVFRNPRKDWYRYEYFESEKTLYIQFNQCVDQPGRETASDFFRRADEFINTHDVERCIVDIRRNDGGNRVYDELIRLLRDNKKINQPGRSFILTGRHTFSAAVIFATQVQLQTNALFIGEPTGQGPVFYGGPALVELPHSRLNFAISQHLTVAGLPFDNREAIIPDIPVDYTIHDFMNGNDPVLELAMTYQSPDQSYPILSRDILERYEGRYLLNQIYLANIKHQGTTLQFDLTDFIPGSLIRFSSVLYPGLSDEFNTDITGVRLRAPESGRYRPDHLILDWLGSEHMLSRAPEGYVSAFEQIYNGQIESGCGTIYQERDAYQTRYPDLEAIVNRIGYVNLRQDSVIAALTLFRLNVDLYPESSNVYDSYGEALMVHGQNDLAIQNYRKSLALNPQNKNAERVIKVLSEL